MKKLLFIPALALLTVCQSPKETKPMTGNPLLDPWDTPFGVPPFDKIKNAHYQPAFEAAMAEHKQEIEAIVRTKESPSFANTIEQFERAGGALTRVSNVFYAVEGAHTNDSLKMVNKVISPQLTQHYDAIYMNKALFDRVNAVYQQKETLNLLPEEKRLLEETYKGFIRSGVSLPDDKQARLRTINSKLAELGQQYGDNLLNETNNFTVLVTKPEDMGNLPASLVATADEAAKDQAKEGWLFTLSRPSVNPFLQYSPNRELRKQLFEGYALRADRDNEYDNKAILQEMAKLRVERANLMGHETHANFVLTESMAESPENVYKFLDQVWPAAIRVAKQEKADYEKMMNSEGISGELQGWDWRYYAEKVKKARYDIEEEQLRPYFEFNAVREGCFALATNLFGLTFRELKDMPKWHEEQQVYEVLEADGKHLGILYMDFFTRASKRGGAWMNDLRAQSNLDGFVTPIVTNNFNFPPPSKDLPSLLSFDEAQTLFHEFGHALHGLFSNVKYESLSGTNTPRDFVEFPSQVMENWMSEPEVLKLFAKHYQTGEVIPDDLIAKIQASGKFDQGFTTVEYMAASYLDMAWHTLKDTTTREARAFEKAEMERIGLISQIIPRYRSGYFSHIFDGGYSSGYYSYLWSEVLDSDAFMAFKETSLFDQETARKYRKMLSMGGSRPGMELYREFRGRDPKIEALLEKKGLN